MTPMEVTTGEPPNPWGSCFDAVAHNVLGNLKEDITICHGIGIASRPGQEGMRVAHAWIEFEHPEGRAALDCIWLKAVPAKKYRDDLKVEYVHEYTTGQFMTLWTQHDFPGPWDQAISNVITHNQRATA